MYIMPFMTARMSVRRSGSGRPSSRGAHLLLLSWTWTEDKVDAEGVLQLHLEHLTASWARNDGSA
jgi:hypothetical protein